MVLMADRQVARKLVVVVDKRVVDQQVVDQQVVDKQVAEVGRLVVDLIEVGSRMMVCRSPSLGFVEHFVVQLVSFLPLNLQVQLLASILNHRLLDHLDFLLVVAIQF